MKITQSKVGRLSKITQSKLGRLSIIPLALAAIFLVAGAGCQSDPVGRQNSGTEDMIDVQDNEDRQTRHLPVQDPPSLRQFAMRASGSESRRPESWRNRAPCDDFCEFNRRVFEKLDALVTGGVHVPGSESDHTELLPVFALQPDTSGRVYRLPSNSNAKCAYCLNSITGHHFRNSSRPLGDQLWCGGDFRSPPPRAEHEEPTPWLLVDIHGNTIE